MTLYLTSSDLPWCSRFSDLDEKYRKRERYVGGSVMDFKEKEGYKPRVQLEYVDDAGRFMSSKEAFRYLSHRFHGKGSGLKKTEKRSKKLEEEYVSTQRQYKSPVIFYLFFFFPRCKIPRKVYVNVKRKTALF